MLASTTLIPILANDPHGGEDLRGLLAGQVLWVTPQQLAHAVLIVPAVATYRYPARRQLAIGYALALASYVIGLVLSAVFDLPSSPVIVWAMAPIGLLVHFGGREKPALSGH